MSAKIVRQAPPAPVLYCGPEWHDSHLARVRTLLASRDRLDLLDGLDREVARRRRASGH